MNTWQDVVDFMNQVCPDCGCFLNNSPACENGCAHKLHPELCDEWSRKVRAN